jgi:hypothetical protein
VGSGTTKALAPRFHIIIGAEPQDLDRSCRSNVTPTVGASPYIKGAISCEALARNAIGARYRFGYCVFIASRILVPCVGAPHILEQSQRTASLCAYRD